MTRKTAQTAATKAANAANSRATSNASGVAFVGTGPGDPELLTVRALRLIEDADVVITEGPEHIDLVARLCGGVDDTGTGPEIVDGGFGEDGQPLTHAARAKVVVKQAKRGLRVVRLLSGDPFLYASGPEEAQAVAKAGLAFEVVPGVSSVGGPGVRRHPAHHQGPPRGCRRHLWRPGRLEPLQRHPDPGAAVGRRPDR